MTWMQISEPWTEGSNSWAASLFFPVIHLRNINPGGQSSYSLIKKNLFSRVAWTIISIMGYLYCSKYYYIISRLSAVRFLSNKNFSIKYILNLYNKLCFINIGLSRSSRVNFNSQSRFWFSELIIVLRINSDYKS